VPGSARPLAFASLYAQPGACISSVCAPPRTVRFLAAYFRRPQPSHLVGSYCAPPQPFRVSARRATGSPSAVLTGGPVLRDEANLGAASEARHFHVHRPSSPIHCHHHHRIAISASSASAWHPFLSHSRLRPDFVCPLSIGCPLRGPGRGCLLFALPYLEHRWSRALSTLSVSFAQPHDLCLCWSCRYTVPLQP
jgi:hypothetical protein